MDLKRLQHLAGNNPQLDDCFHVLEAVEIPADASYEQVMQMFDAARRAMSIAHKLPKEQRSRHFSKILTGMNKIRAYLKRLGAVEPNEAV